VLAFAFYHDPLLPGYSFGECLCINGTPGYFVKIDTFRNPGGPIPPFMSLQVNRTNYIVPYLIHTYGIDLVVRNTHLFIRILFRKTGSEGHVVNENLPVIVWRNSDLIDKTPVGTPLINETVTVSFNIMYGGYIGFTSATGSRYDVHAIEWFHVLANSSIASVGGELVDNNTQQPMYLSLLIIAIISLSISTAIICKKLKIKR